MQIADFDASNNLVELFLRRADELGDKPFLTTKREGAWHSQSWREVADQVCLLAESLRALGCDLGQGFLFAHPLRADDSVDFVAERQRPTADAP